MYGTSYQASHNTPMGPSQAARDVYSGPKSFGEGYTPSKETVIEADLYPHASRQPLARHNVEHVQVTGTPVEEKDPYSNPQYD